MHLVFHRNAESYVKTFFFKTVIYTIVGHIHKKHESFSFLNDIKQNDNRHVSIIKLEEQLLNSGNLSN